MLAAAFLHGHVFAVLSAEKPYFMIGLERYFVVVVAVGVVGRKCYFSRDHNQLNPRRRHFVDTPQNLNHVHRDCGTGMSSPNACSVEMWDGSNLAELVSGPGWFTGSLSLLLTNSKNEGRLVCYVCEKYVASSFCDTNAQSYETRFMVTDQEKKKFFASHCVCDISNVI